MYYRSIVHAYAHTDGHGMTLSIVTNLERQSQFDCTSIVAINHCLTAGTCLLGMCLLATLSNSVGLALFIYFWGGERGIIIRTLICYITA